MPSGPPSSPAQPYNTDFIFIFYSFRASCSTRPLTHYAPKEGEETTTNASFSKVIAHR
jgi:hypothetical protein